MLASCQHVHHVHFSCDRSGARCLSNRCSFLLRFRIPRLSCNQSSHVNLQSRAWAKMVLLWACVAFSFAMYWLIYLFSEPLCLALFSPLRSKSRRDQLQAFIRVPSLVNCILTVPLAFYMLSINSGGLSVDRITGSTWLSSFLLASAAGYFLFDVTQSFFDYHGHAFLMHALVCSYVYTGSLVTPFVQYYGCVFLLFESSTIFLNVGWYLKNVYEVPSNSWPMMINNFFFASFFFLSRIAYGFYQSYHFIVDLFALRAQNGAIPTMGLMFMAVNIFLCALNLFWFYKIVRMITRSSSDKTRTKSKKPH